MSGSEADFRQRARRVRAEARAHLRALRDGRRRDRSPRDETTREDVPRRTDDVAEPMFEAAWTDRFIATDRATEVARQALDADGFDRSAMEGPAATNDEAVSEQVTASPPSEEDQRATSAPQTDLYRLPGAGPGLVWMLQQAEIQSLAELAAADSTELERRLGLVGALLDIPAWIALAARIPLAESARR